MREVTIGPLAIRVLGRAYPSTDPWTCAWLSTTMSCQAPGAEVRVEGPLLRTSDVEEWVLRLEDLLASEEAVVLLTTLEPNLEVRLTGERRAGLVRIQILLTPDPQRQHHSFWAESDYRSMATLLAGCRELLAAYPPSA